MTADSSSDTPPKAFSTLDIVKAITFGWDEHHSLSMAEAKVIQFVASRGVRKEPGMAFSWFPLGGQPWWAAMMAMTPEYLRKTLQRLREKGLVVNLPGSMKDPRFAVVRGYAVPDSVLLECQEWVAVRSQMVFTLVPDTVEQMFGDVTNSHAPVTDSHIDVTNGHGHNAVTRAFAPHNPVETQREPAPLTRSDSPAGGRRLEADPMRYQDEWEVPKEERPEKRKGKEPYRKPSMRLAEVFDNERFKASQDRKMLSTSWSTKQAFLTRLNELLETRTEEQVAEMIRLFFVLLAGGKVIPRAEELWRDFWNHRAQCDRMVREREASQPVSGGITVSTEHIIVRRGK